jgi:HD-GYP domain-containing protein (c-di-GMP phosphodiesterase class II)
MTSNRPYHQDKKGKPPEVAFEEVRQMAGKQFDPECAKAFIDIQQEVIETMSSNRQTTFLQVR